MSGAATGSATKRRGLLLVALVVSGLLSVLILGPLVSNSNPIVVVALDPPVESRTNAGEPVMFTGSVSYLDGTPVAGGFVGISTYRVVRSGTYTLTELVAVGDAAHIAPDGTFSFFPSEDVGEYLFEVNLVHLTDGRNARMANEANATHIWDRIVGIQQVDGTQGWLGG